MPSSTKSGPHTSNPSDSYQPRRCAWAWRCTGRSSSVSAARMRVAARPVPRWSGWVTTRPIREPPPGSARRRIVAATVPSRSIHQCCVSGRRSSPSSSWYGQFCSTTNTSIRRRSRSWSSRADSSVDQRRWIVEFSADTAATLSWPPPGELIATRGVARHARTRRETMGPLSGVRVIEIAGIGPGPFCAMIAADMGADVVRVDRAQSVRGGDPSAPPADVLNRGRRSIGVDLKHPDGVAVVLDLVEGADALLEGFRPGVAERLGIGPDDCLARNPKLVYGRMTGWGQSGPYAHTAGHDINYIALAGA